MASSVCDLGYPRGATDGQGVDARVRKVRAAGAGRVFGETACGARTDRAQFRRVLGRLAPDDALMATRFDRLVRSTRPLLNTLAWITGRKAGFRLLGDALADTTTAHGQPMLTVLGGLAEFERGLIRAGWNRPPAIRARMAPAMIERAEQVHAGPDGEGSEGRGIQKFDIPGMKEMMVG